MPPKRGNPHQKARGSRWPRHPANCVACEKLLSGDVMQAPPVCGHVLHRACAEQWKGKGGKLGHCRVCLQRYRLKNNEIQFLPGNKAPSPSSETQQFKQWSNYNSAVARSNTEGLPGAALRERVAKKAMWHARNLRRKGGKKRSRSEIEKELKSEAGAEDPNAGTRKQRYLVPVQGYSLPPPPQRASNPENEE